LSTADLRKGLDRRLSAKILQLENKKSIAIGSSKQTGAQGFVKNHKNQNFLKKFQKPRDVFEKKQTYIVEDARLCLKQ
jgi:hypothetical protein